MKTKLRQNQEITFEPDSDKVYSVSQLNHQIRRLLEGEYPLLWVEGEVSNFKHHSSGHIYMTLKDEKSQISAVFFSRYNQSLRFRMKDGLKVVAMGKISLYEPRGQYQLYIEKLEPKGMGALQLAFMQLKEKLQKQGLFDRAHKKPIPKFPKTVGVITSPTGAAIQDILNVMNRRSASTGVLLNPVRVQGEGAGEEVAQAIRQMNQIPGIDVLIVGRGGGSLEDLWAFNEEVVARAVFESRIPIISAVGHEIDWTICDMVSDLRAPTPSAAAELVVQNREELIQRLKDLKVRIQNGVQNHLERKRSELLNLENSYALKQPMMLIQQFSQRLDELFRQLGNYSKALVTQKKQVFQNLVGRLHALSPLSILERGYSLSFDKQGNVLKTASKIKVGDSIKTRLSDGILHSKVARIEDAKGEKS